MVKREKPLVYQVTEEGFQRTVMECAGHLGWEVWHDQDSRKNAPGLPDLVCIHPDHGVVWLELKTMKGRIRPHQKYWIDLLTRAGQRAYIVRPNQMDALEALFRGEVQEIAV